MTNFDASEEAAKLNADAEEGISISSAYNSLDENQRKEVFKEMTGSSESQDGLSDLMIIGEDTDGDRKPDQLKDILDPSTGEDLYNKPGEADHSEEAWGSRWRPILKEDPQFQEQFREIIRGGGAYESPINGVSPSAFRRDALEGMIEKHGLDRVKETFNGLEEISGSKKFYSHSLHTGYGEGVADIERKMGYIGKLMEPGNLEKARELGKILNQEGFKRNPSLKELSDPDLVNLLVENEDEREAYKKFSDTPLGPISGFFREHEGDLDGLKPSEKLELYEDYEREWTRLRAEENRPYQEEIDKHGKPVKDVLTEAMKENDVLIIGERHTEKSPLRELTTEMIGDLKQAGATHFAVEMTPKQLQSYLKDGDMKHLPGGLRHQDFVDLISKVQDEGLELVATNSSGTDQERDDYMAKVISDTLKEDPNNKVAFFVGYLHGADTSAGANRSAANLLRDQGVSVATVMEQSPITGLDSLWNKAKVDEPTAIKTEDTPKIRELEFISIGNDIEEKYGLLDIVIMFPREEKQ